MNEPTSLINDPARLESLLAFGILDTPPEKEFDDFAFLAGQVGGTPAAMITFVDEQREWVKSRCGLEACEFSLESSFGAQTIAGEGNLLLVPDARTDVRFCNHPFIKQVGGFVSYAGVPLVTSNGQVVGILSILGYEPLRLKEDQILSLQLLASQLIRWMEARQKITALECRYSEVLKFAGKAAHDLKSPLCSISLMAELFRELYGEKLDHDGVEMLVSIGEAVNQLARQIDDLLTEKISC
jgi:signal transduction histidine kinase